MIHDSQLLGFYFLILNERTDSFSWSTTWVLNLKPESVTNLTSSKVSILGFYLDSI